MKLESQVCNLEIAKRLKELGVKQNSLWWWNKEGIHEYITSNKMMDYYVASAFTVAELGEMLPTDTPSSKMHTTYMCWMAISEDGETYWDEKFQESGEKLTYENFHADTEADAKAKMLVYLKEKKL